MGRSILSKIEALARNNNARIAIGVSDDPRQRSVTLAGAEQSQKKGLALFNSVRLNCTTCHSGAYQSDYSFQNIGLEHQALDSGRARITRLPEDAGKFAVPSLRNVALTPPYMHDGSINTLEEVIIYLENGGGNHPNKSELIKPFHLTNTERENLIHFLESLTSKSIVSKN